MAKPQSRWLPMLLAVCIFMQMLDATVLNTALPQMAADLHQSALNMQSAVVSYALTLALFMPLSGYITDRYGTKKVFAVSMGLFVFGSLMCAAAPNLPMLVVARVVQGLGGAMMVPVPRLIVLRAYEKDELLERLNFIVMPALLGPVVGPLVGGYLVQYASWHWVFLINVPFGLTGIALALKIMPDFYAADGAKPHFDLTGFLLFGGAAVGLSLSVEMLTHPGARLFSALCGAGGLSALWLYWRHARHDGDHALYPPRLRLVRTFRLGILGNLISRLGMGAMPFLMPLLLQVAFARSASEAGWTLAPVALAALATKPLVKPVIGRFGYRRVLIWNTRIIGLLIMSMALVTAATPLWLLVPALFCMGMCNSLQYSSMNTLTLADLRPQMEGSGNSLMAVNQQLAISLGIGLGAMLLNFFGGGGARTADVHHAFRLTFISIGAVTFCAGWIFTFLHPKDGGNLVGQGGEKAV
ncbi:TPA: MFS transporter [Neisseria bacilliformis]